MDKKTLERANLITGTLEALEKLRIVMLGPYPQFLSSDNQLNSACFDKETLDELKNTMQEFIRKRRSKLESEFEELPAASTRTSDTIKADPVAEAVNLLLNDKIDQMINVDTLISLLIQKGVFTKDEFDRIKQAIKGTDQYQKIYRLTDRVAESLDPTLAHTRITDQELEELLACLSPGEMGEK